MATSKFNVARGTQAGYWALATKNADTVYFCTDTGNMYLGNTLLFERNAFVEAALGTGDNAKVITFTCHSGADKDTTITKTLDLASFALTSELDKAVKDTVKNLIGNGLAIDSTTSVISVKNADSSIDVSSDGIKVSDTYTNGVKNALIGTAEDTKDSDTIKGAKKYADEVAAADKYVTVDSQAITSTGSLISGSLTITSDNNGGSASLSVNPTLTTSTATATAIATKEYVDEKATSEKTVYSFGEDVAFVQSKDEQGKAINEYTVTVDLMSKTGEASAVKADSIKLTLDSSKFVVDGMLDSVAYSTEEGKENVLVFTWNTDAGKTKTEIDLSKYIDTYTGGDGITIPEGSHEISVKVSADGYLGFSDDDELIIKVDKIQKGDKEGASDLLATKGYVDEQVGAAISVSATDVNAFGSAGSIEVKKGDTSLGKFTVTLPELSATEGKSTSENVAVGLTGGAISVTTKEQGATDTTTYSNTNLAQAAYVDEKVAASELVWGSF